MNLIDLHCDTLWKLMDLGGEGDLLENDGSVSIRKLEEEGALAQFFACFVYRDAMEGNTPEEQYEAGYGALQRPAGAGKKARGNRNHPKKGKNRSGPDCGGGRRAERQPGTLG